MTPLEIIDHKLMQKTEGRPFLRFLANAFFVGICLAILAGLGWILFELHEGIYSQGTVWGVVTYWPTWLFVGAGLAGACLVDFIDKLTGRGPE